MSRFTLATLLGLLAASLIGLTPTLEAAVEGRPAGASRPFFVGERYTYSITWLNITAGTAVMEVAGTDERSGPVTFLTTARSSPMITKFYPVDNRVESIVDPGTLLPKEMTFRRREGKRKNDFHYVFDHRKGSVSATKDGSVETMPIPRQTQDAISCLYYVRSTLPFTPGATVVLDVHHDKKNYKLEVRVEAIETVRGPWGAVQAARVLAVMPFQGIFLNEGNVRVWFTTDDRRVPVRMKAKVIIGSIVADLVQGFPSGPR